MNLEELRQNDSKTKRQKVRKDKKRQKDENTERQKYRKTKRCKNGLQCEQCK